MDKIEKICKFVKELQRDFISIHPKDCSLELIKSYAGYTYLDKVLSFLDTLSEEPDKELEEAAEKYRRDTCNEACKQGFLDNNPSPSIKSAFITGAEWKEQQMLKDAEECELYLDGDFLAIDLDMAALGYSEKDKVKVIVIKEGE